MKRINKSRVFDGFCERDFNPNIDGWMDEQLPQDLIPSVGIAQDILSLYAEVNQLRRENWELRRSLEHYKS